MKKIFIFLLIFFITQRFVPFSVHASSAPTVTVVNPLRGHSLGLENADLLTSLKSQWSYTRSASVSATWLWQYSALEDVALTDYAKQEMVTTPQEHGVFLEIDKNTADKAEVGFKGKNQWYHSDGLLLVSYDSYERKKIIDTVFEKFHSVFGYYPLSAGAWWVGADSINYMRQKYHITSVLQCSDQFNTDAYSIWGTPWSIPYLSRADNSAVPALNPQSSSNVVVMQWAPRDPNRGYGDSVTHSTYSMQDYATKGYNLRYVQFLQNIFLKRSGDQLVFGLEGGLLPSGYRDYGNQIAQTAKWQQEGTLQIQTMKEYAAGFLDSQKILPPTNYFLSSDYENNDQSFWYNSAYYRLFLSKTDTTISLVDLRDYTNTPPEDFNQVPNTQKLLRINTLALIDSVRLPFQRLSFNSTGDLRVQEKAGHILLFSGDILIGDFSSQTAKLHKKTYTFTKKETLAAQNNALHFHSEILLKKERLAEHFSELKRNAFQGRKNTLKTFILFYISLGLIATFFVFRSQNHKKLALLIPLGLFLAVTFFLYRYLTIRDNIILTPYESQALQILKDSKKNIDYLEPKYNLEFRAIKPFLYAKPAFSEKLTSRKWRYLKRREGHPLQLTPQKNTILIVPRYLGEELYPEEIIQYNLTKLFDNAQISLYEYN